MVELFPSLPLREWNDTKQTLHRFLQIVGKIRMSASPRRNHWWHVPFHLTGNGITIRPMGMVDGNPLFTVDFNLVSYLLVVRTVEGRSAEFSLPGHSVASFYRETLATLEGLGVHARTRRPWPFDLPDSGRRFEEDIEHATYGPAAVNRYWRIISQVAMVLEEFAADCSGKTSSVHHFWHTFDIVMNRFGTRPLDQPREAGPIVREAYSRDVTSFGFWFGDDSVPEPAFYAYAVPEPDGLATRPLAPSWAEWVPSGDGNLALLRYDRVREEPDPKGVVLSFYESAYRAGAELLGWDIDAVACPNGVTDPIREGE